MKINKNTKIILGLIVIIIITIVGCSIIQQLAEEEDKKQAIIPLPLTEPVAEPVTVTFFPEPVELLPYPDYDPDEFRCPTFEDFKDKEDFDPLWLDGKIIKVNPEKNYIIIQPDWPENAEQIKIFLPSASRMIKTKTTEATIADFLPGGHISLETKESIYNRTIIKDVDMLYIHPLKDVDMLHIHPLIEEPLDF